MAMVRARCAIDCLYILCPPAAPPPRAPPGPPALPIPPPPPPPPGPPPYRLGRSSAKRAILKRSKRESNPKWCQWAWRGHTSQPASKHPQPAPRSLGSGKLRTEANMLSTYAPSLYASPKNLNAKVHPHTSPKQVNLRNHHVTTAAQCEASADNIHRLNQSNARCSGQM